jgi:hypothetical protein
LCDLTCTENISNLLNTVLTTSSICLSFYYSVILSFSLCQYFKIYFFFSYSLLRSLIISTFLSRFLYWRRLFIILILSPPPFSSPHLTLLSLPLSHTSPYHSTRIRSSWHVIPVHPRNSTHRGMSVNSRARRALSNQPCPSSFYCFCIELSLPLIRFHSITINSLLSLSSIHHSLLSFPLFSRMIPSPSRIPYIISITRPSLKLQYYV